MMKRLFLFLYSVCVFISPTAASAATGEIEILNGPAYFDAAHKAITEAKESVVLVMYYINFRKDEPGSKVSVLTEDLVSAKKRGIKVKVILDQTVVFKGDRLLGRDFENTEMNTRAFNYLKSNGVDVSLDKSEITTHVKCIIVDGEIVILGSHNWTKNSLMMNNELSVLIKSKEIAAECLSDIDKIQIDHEASAREAERYVVLNNDILINTLSSFVSNSNDYCFNVFLYLIGHYAAGEDIDFDYTKVADYLGISGKMTEEHYREMLGWNTLKDLQDKYGMLTFAPKRGKNAYVVLRPFGDAAKGCFEIPKKFWDYGWDRRLSPAERFCYFVNLIEGGPERNMWMLSKASLVDKYKVGKEVISNGMAGLRHWNLLEIEYGNIDFGKGYDERLPNRYRLKGLYRIEDFEAELKKLSDKYGEKKVEAARALSKIVFCENNLVDVEDIIKMIDEYGADNVNYAFNKVADRSEDNPKRSIAFVKGILESMQRDNGKVQKSTME